jgi:hypothetical protein
MTNEELINALWAGNTSRSVIIAAAESIKALSGNLKFVLAREVATQERHDNKMEALEAKLARAVEGLQFYTERADYEYHQVTRGCGCYSDMEDPIILDDKGNLARLVLAEIKKETK